MPYVHTNMYSTCVCTRRLCRRAHPPYDQHMSAKNWSVNPLVAVTYTVVHLRFLGCSLLVDVLCCLNIGQARDVFGVENMAALRGAYGVGHVRYPTSGCNGVEEAQVCTGRSCTHERRNTVEYHHNTYVVSPTCRTARVAWQWRIWPAIQILHGSRLHALRVVALL